MGSLPVRMECRRGGSSPERSATLNKVKRRRNRAARLSGPIMGLASHNLHAYGNTYVRMSEALLAYSAGFGRDDGRWPKEVIR